MVITHRRGTAPHTILFALCILLALVAPVTAATTELHVVRYAADGVTVLGEKTVDYRWLEANLPVQGDGETHYYHQGPVFVGDPWNPEEDTNVEEKDMGAVKGTNLADICDLVSGMKEGEIVRVKAIDGMSREFPYRNVYEPESRQGPMVITWYKADEGYVPDYYTGMRLVFFADTSTNPYGIHAFGVTDMRECFDPEYWYFYNGKYPTTTGLSVQSVSEVIIYSEEEATGSIRVNSTPTGAVVYIDDEETGYTTPCTLSGIEVGTHSVRVEKEGYIQPDEVWINVVANTVVEAAFNLTPETGSIAVSTIPTNASILLDGNVTGLFTDAVLEEVPVGEHMVELVLPGYRNATQKVVVEKDECTTIDLVLFSENTTPTEVTPGTGSIFISSVPTNASILIDGKETGTRTNATLDAVPAGEHTIELVMPGYRNVTRTVIVKSGESSTLEMILSPVDGKTGANASAGRDGTSTTHPTQNPLEAFIAAVLNLLATVFPFFEAEEDLPTTQGPESTPTPDEYIATSSPTGTPAPPKPTPGDVLNTKNHSGGLYIESYPPGMTIVIDNKRQVWQTPHVVYGLREGLHSIGVEETEPGRSGKDSDFHFETVQAWVYPDAITPVRLDGVAIITKKTVKIDSEDYRGAKFTVNGRYPPGTIPGEAVVDGPKSWITVSQNGTYLSYRIPNSLESGQTFIVKPWSGSTVPLRIDSSPRGAAVFIDGFPTGEVTPCRVEGLSPGQHRILVSKPGYIPAEDTITIPEGAETGGAVTCTLREYTNGNLHVESTVRDGRIYLYGRYTGEKTPHTFTGMSIGTYEVRVVTENASKTVMDVLVTPGETARCMVVLKEGNP